VRLVRVALPVLVLAGAALVSAAGCREATQVTVEISLSDRASCTDVHGTAITVGVEPSDTEKRVQSEFVNASTTSCDATSRSIGTLVVTPSDKGGASVIVVVAYAPGISPASCKPPLYTGCIVARRHFGFTPHRDLHLPITIDPECRNVPCDAFSTCRTGKCFTSEAACEGTVCPQPGDPGDGGTSVDGQVIPDTGVPDDGAKPGDDGSVGADSGGDAGVDAADGASEAGTAATRCDPPGASGKLTCGSQSCEGATSYCCGANEATATCRKIQCNAGETRFCCQSADCGGSACLFTAPANAAPMPPQLPIAPRPGGGSTVGTCGAVVIAPPPPPP
jgi:hypothetical protein